jgi:hypothetical protein
VARDSLRPLLIEWVNSAPRSVDAHIALADLLELDGNAIVVGSDRRSSLEELRIARTLPADSVTQLDLMRSQVRLLLKKPDFTAARATADSALRQWRSPSADLADRLVGLAALTGDLEAASRLLEQLSATPRRGLRDRHGQPMTVPVEVLRERARFVARAVTGVCDSVTRAAPRHLAELVRAFHGRDGLAGDAVSAVLERPLLQAIPCVGVGEAELLDAQASPAGRVANALRLGDVHAARELFDSVSATVLARPLAVEDPDFRFSLACMGAAVGRPGTADSLLRRAIDGLPSLPAAQLSSEFPAGALPRVYHLAAELARARGDSRRAGALADSAKALRPMELERPVMCEAGPAGQTPGTTKKR